MSTESALLMALRQALELDTANGPLWAHYGELQLQAGNKDEAVIALRKAVELGQNHPPLLCKLLATLRDQGLLAESLIRAESALSGHDLPAVRVELARTLVARGQLAEADENYHRAIKADPSLVDSSLETAFSSLEQTVEELEAEERDDPEVMDESPVEPELKEMAIGDGTAPSLDDFDSERERITFADVVGLDDVKRQINLRIIAPFKKKHIFQAFSRQAGGGILLYGPPGCGKTFIARATAGEVGADFITVGIHEIVDKYFGESEKMVHHLFEEARRRAPTVLFFDEFDALGGNRRGGESQYWKTLVDQLLQEMDGVGRRNDSVLVFAATNAPWNVDTAFRRPGRFDRLLFVPPPDLKARVEMLRRMVSALPGGASVAVESLAPLTELFTGADMQGLCDRASEAALAQSLETDQVHPITTDDFRRELRSLRSTAEEWFATAKNYARYSNDGGQYDELAGYLKRVKRW